MSTSKDSKSAVKKFGLSLFAGGGAGAISKTCVAPLERIKILLQVQTMQVVSSTSGTRYSGITEAVTGIIRNEGPGALWKGNLANCVRIVPVCALKFTFFDNIKKIFIPKDNNFSNAQLISRKVAAGSLSGALMLCCVYPLEVVKTRLTADTTKASAATSRPTMVRTASTMLRKEGPKAFYKGLAPSLLGIMPYLGISFGLFDTLKETVPVGESGVHSQSTKLAMGGFAGLIAQTAAFPIDTVRNRMQMNGVGGAAKRYTGTADCFRKIYFEEGWRAFYRGVHTNAIKAVPSVAIEFLMYDMLKEAFFGLTGMED